MKLLVVLSALFFVFALTLMSFHSVGSAAPMRLLRRRRDVIVSLFQTNLVKAAHVGDLAVCSTSAASKTVHNLKAPFHQNGLLPAMTRGDIHAVIELAWRSLVGRSLFDEPPLSPPPKV